VPKIVRKMHFLTPFCTRSAEGTKSLQGSMPCDPIVTIGSDLPELFRKK